MSKRSNDGTVFCEPEISPPHYRAVSEGSEQSEMEKALGLKYTLRYSSTARDDKASDDDVRRKLIQSEARRNSVDARCGALEGQLKEHEHKIRALEREKIVLVQRLLESEKIISNMNEEIAAYKATKSSLNQIETMQKGNHPPVIRCASSEYTEGYDMNLSNDRGSLGVDCSPGVRSNSNIPKSSPGAAVCREIEREAKVRHLISELRSENTSLKLKVRKLENQQSMMVPFLSEEYHLEDHRRLREELEHAQYEDVTPFEYTHSTFEQPIKAAARKTIIKGGKVDSSTVSNKCAPQTVISKSVKDMKPACTLSEATTPRKSLTSVRNTAETSRINSPFSISSRNSSYSSIKVNKIPPPPVGRQSPSYKPRSSSSFSATPLKSASKYATKCPPSPNVLSGSFNGARTPVNQNANPIYTRAKTSFPRKTASAGPEFKAASGTRVKPSMGVPCTHIRPSKVSAVRDESLAFKSEKFTTTFHKTRLVRHCEWEQPTDKSIGSATAR